MIIILIVLIYAIPSLCQNNSDYFPYKTGDMWEYLHADPPFFDTLQIFTVYDSVDIYGNIYLTQTQRYINPITPVTFYFDTMYFRIDTLNQVWGRAFEEENRLTYKLNGVQGDKWIVENHEPTYVMGRIGKRDSVNIFGQKILYMNTYYYITQDTTDTLGLVIYTSNLAKGLGLIWRGGGEYLGSINLKGAVINGELYGDTTQIITSVFDSDRFLIKTGYAISQNYPNPFNSQTKIKFYLPERTFVKLKIFDLLGNEVKILINEEKDIGHHEIDFDGTGLPSGIYFYTLQTPKFIQTKKMVLLK